jgi:hypothetical protein
MKKIGVAERSLPAQQPHIFSHGPAIPVEPFGTLFTKYLDRMGFGVWLVGCADQPNPKISFFRRACPACPDVLCQGSFYRVRRESGRAFHKGSDLVKAVNLLVQRIDSIQK